jgi:hypothetical protein
VDPISQGVPATPEVLEEALALSEDALADIELSRIPLASVALKASRLARLLNDFEAQQMFRAEAGGYPSGPAGVDPQTWHLAELAGRTYEAIDDKTKQAKTVAFVESIGQLESDVEGAKIGLEAAKDPNVSLASANPHQVLSAPRGNMYERAALHRNHTTASQRLASRRALIHEYVSRRYYELKFSGAAQNVFSAVREAVDGSIGETVPGAVQQLASVLDNLRSQNPEDWSNAVHSCRRILQNLADAVFPAQDEKRTLGDGHSVNLGPDNYINRLVCYAEDNSDSARFHDLVGSHLKFLGDRLDAVFHAAQKGSHAAVSHDEANRYVIYTYMLVGDILALRS